MFWSVERVSFSTEWYQGNATSADTAISADGRFVAFVSLASTLVPGDNNRVYDVFVHDRKLGTTERVSVDAAGGQASNVSASPSLSADGRVVAFGSFASNLVPGDTNDIVDVFVHDRETGAIERVRVDAAGNRANFDSYEPALSADGQLVAFSSNASNLVPGDDNGQYDVFVVDRSRDVVTGTDRNDVMQPGKVSAGVTGGPSDEADVIDARLGADLVRAGGGDDILYGDGETIGGRGGNDKLFGDFGGDLGVSRGGADKLTGGLGADNFYLGRGKHQVTDFLQREDVLDIGNLGLTFADLDSDSSGSLTRDDDFVTVKGTKVTIDVGAAGGGAAGGDLTAIVVGKGVIIGSSDSSEVGYP